MGFYFGFGVLLHLTFRNSKHVFLRRYAAILAILVGIFYGITDEFHQSFVPRRSSSEWDVLADSVGVVVAQAGILVLIIKHLWDKKNKKTIDQFKKVKKKKKNDHLRE
ncbi:MAG: VanZ like family protein [Methanomethylovorans sp. PtaU1.Bin093]|uniref:VanZ family protein n=1 Tax=Methanomethylovorans sp. PtaU1.Bin093 TaxID=1811679 RepID=UPI0009CC91D4|nr:VanZ family protein [Methanomethylovorans sp. PtaU1.Bin093]OPY19806.1 MAG: VanZ like family protein [Methanomethylovorans sp. PtaU1.Bin093]